MLHDTVFPKKTTTIIPITGCGPFIGGSFKKGNRVYIMFVC